MDTLVHADIFFFVTTIAVVIVAAAFTIVLVYIARVLSDIKKITEHVHEEAVLFREDLGDLRASVRKEGFKIQQVMSFLAKFVHGKKVSRSKTSAK